MTDDRALDTSLHARRHRERMKDPEYRSAYEQAASSLGRRAILRNSGLVVRIEDERPDSYLVRPPHGLPAKDRDFPRWVAKPQLYIVESLRD